jgi:hypothetical protein
MKSLQAEEKAVQAQKIARQAQLEPLQEKAEQLVMEIDAKNKGGTNRLGGRRYIEASSHHADGGSHDGEEKPG